MSTNAQKWLAQATVATAKRGNWWNPEQGDNVIRVFPFQHTVTEGDLALGRFDPRETPVGSVESVFFATKRTHRSDDKPLPCGLMRTHDGQLIGRCAKCDEASGFLKSKTKDDQEKGFKLKAREQHAVYVYDIGKKKAGIWEAPKALINHYQTCFKMMKYQGEELIGFKGRDLFVIYDKNQPPVKMYTFDFADSGKTAVLDPKTVGDIPDLYALAQYVPAEFQKHLPMPAKVEGKFSSNDRVFFQDEEQKLQTGVVIRAGETEVEVRTDKAVYTVPIASLNHMKD